MDILLVEDDKKLVPLIREYLEANGFSVAVEGRGDAATRRIVEEQPALVILDRMLPGLDGVSVCRSVRPAYNGPILMLTALGSQGDEVLGLEMGADDYLAKPVKPLLLLARIRALLRRVTPADATIDRPSPGSPITMGSLSIDLDNRRVQLGEAEIPLTTVEFDALWVLAQNAGQVMTRDQLSRALRGIDYDGQDRTIDLRISRLRKKLGDVQHRYIKSVHGVGYVLVKNP